MATAILSLSNEIKGVRELNRLLERLENEGKDMRTPLDLCGTVAIRETAQNFKSEGIPALGIRWKKLSKWTLNNRKRRKGRRKTRFKDNILRDTGILANSVTSKTSRKGSIYKLRRDSLRLGTKLDYAAAHQFGQINPERRIPNVKVKRHKIKAHTRKTKAGRLIRVKKHTIKKHTRTQFVPKTVTPKRPFLAVTPTMADGCVRQFNNWLDDLLFGRAN